MHERAWRAHCIICTHRVKPRERPMWQPGARSNTFKMRFIPLQQECVDHFVVLGQRHLDYLVTEWLELYHRERPHQAKDNDLLLRRKPRRKKAKRAPPEDDVLPLSEVRCEQRLGGLLKHYYRRAA
jgi:putative transposase